MRWIERTSRSEPLLRLAIGCGAGMLALTAGTKASTQTIVSSAGVIRRTMKFYPQSRAAASSRKRKNHLGFETINGTGLGPKTGEQLLGRLPQRWMQNVRRNRGQRGEHESPFMHCRVRNFQMIIGNYAIAE